MLPDLILHLALLRSFQLPIELRCIVVETFFPFMSKERAPFLKPEDLLCYLDEDDFLPMVKHFHFIDISDTTAITLCLKKDGLFLHAMIGRGCYDAWRAHNRPVFMQIEVLFCEDEMVRLSLRAEEICVEKIIRFYRTWVLSAIYGVGDFRNYRLGGNELIFSS